MFAQNFTNLDDPVSWKMIVNPGEQADKDWTFYKSFLKQF